ncbi:MAG TPA: hypothetical protein VH914_06820 [Acidimicrobiia bacterium]|jgi:hypothetical protein|nr:hypothetical protein [Acidimicrobiia bacterium]
MRRLVLAVLLGLAAVTAAPAAVSAASAAHAPEFVGTYRLHVEYPPNDWRGRGQMKIRADGTGLIEGAYKFVWSNQKNDITIYCELCGTTMYGTLTRKGISRKNVPGTFNVRDLYWYAVRTNQSSSS